MSKNIKLTFSQFNAFTSLPKVAETGFFILKYFTLIFYLRLIYSCKFTIYLCCSHFEMLIWNCYSEQQNSYRNHSHLQSQLNNFLSFVAITYNHVPFQQEIDQRWWWHKKEISNTSFRYWMKRRRAQKLSNECNNY